MLEVETLSSEILLTSSEAPTGTYPSAILVAAIPGNHSWVLQAPLTPPVSWCTRTAVGRSGVLAAARPMMVSATHFDSAYPEPTAIRSSLSGASLKAASGS